MSVFSGDSQGKDIHSKPCSIHLLKMWSGNIYLALIVNPLKEPTHICRSHQYIENHSSIMAIHQHTSHGASMSGACSR